MFNRVCFALLIATPLLAPSNAYSNGEETWVACHKQWLVGGLLGLAGGAAAGYAAGNRDSRKTKQTDNPSLQGCRGDQGPTGPTGAPGPEGPSGPTGEGALYTEEAMFLSFLNQISPESDLEDFLSVRLYDPTGGLWTVQTLGGLSTFPCVFFIDGMTKLEGTYQLLLFVNGNSVSDTAIGTFYLNGKPFTLVSGQDPAVIASWTDNFPDPTSLLQVEFP